MANRNGNVSALITAEAIIAGFMITYGALGDQLLIHWSKQGRPETTYLAGMMANAIILTCFASIYILFRSINTVVEYEAGYNLFKLALLGSAIFVIINAFSISHFTAFTPHMAFSLSIIDTCHLVFASGGAFVGYVGFLLMVVWKSWLARTSKFYVFVSCIVVPPILCLMMILWWLSYVFMLCPSVVS